MSCSLHVNVCLSDDDDLSIDEEDVVFDFCRVKRMANFYLLHLFRGFKVEMRWKRLGYYLKIKGETSQEKFV